MRVRAWARVPVGSHSYRSSEPASASGTASARGHEHVLAPWKGPAVASARGLGVEAEAAGGCGCAGAPALRVAGASCCCCYSASCFRFVPLARCWLGTSGEGSRYHANAAPSRPKAR